jgi:hypothetical protein
MPGEGITVVILAPRAYRARMMTAARCLTKAAEMDALCRLYTDDDMRESCMNTANGWRNAAILARHQEAWAETNPNP